ncbi:C40 family peptidase [Hoyosella rhizosphaerae]|uniref:Endopeptidase n=1 Tax=Hoyosella rhizosphaerae TaxID=1755582 RepID=A0A916XGA5_9ACTN|nr:NlpC/P60 family protein [Hoyosella rhizosphaerae]MBN4927947.1 C40 family peptidase [Hoyosella rhizosphaerae]GGC71206.1 endopeptidase [Hoyosella rhizosphaerae]
MRLPLLSQRSRAPHFQAPHIQANSPQRFAAVLCTIALSAVLVTAPHIGNPPSAAAHPDITNATEALQRLTELSRDATRANDQVLTAEIRLEELHNQLGEAEERQHELGRAASEARDRIAELQEIVDKFTAANYRGVRVDPIYALLTSDSPQTLITQLSALEIISRDTGERIKDFESARATYETAERLARESAERFLQLTRDAQAQHATLQSRQSVLQGQIEEIKALYETLSEEERERWIGAIIPPGFDPDLVRGSGVGAEIVRAALSRIGTPYVWGATGPNEFDCSGLVMWAHNQLGRSVPRTSQMQAQGGMPVRPAEIQPGDVVVYYADASHVGLYIGNGQIVHASTFGVPVKVDPVNNAPIHAIRRY